MTRSHFCWLLLATLAVTSCSEPSCSVERVMVRMNVKLSLKNRLESEESPLEGWLVHESQTGSAQNILGYRLKASTLLFDTVVVFPGPEELGVLDDDLSIDPWIQIKGELYRTTRPLKLESKDGQAGQSFSEDEIGLKNTQGRKVGDLQIFDAELLGAKPAEVKSTGAK